MQMPGRSFSSSNSNYGFNGKRKDNEVYGDGNEYDYGFRIYNPRIGKFLSVDPLTKAYPWWSPYHFAGNTPVQAIDLDGLEILDYRTFYRFKVSKPNATMTSYDIAFSLYDPETVTKYDMKDTHLKVTLAIKGASPSESISMEDQSIVTLVELQFNGNSAQASGTLSPSAEPQDVIQSTSKQQLMDAYNRGAKAGVQPDLPIDPKTKKETRGTVNNYLMRNATSEAKGNVLVSIIQWIGESFCPNHLKWYQNAQSDLATMKQAYLTAYEVVNKYTIPGVSDENLIAQYRVDLVNYVVDLKLPVNGTWEYYNWIKLTGQTIIDENKSLQTKKKLASDKGN